MKQVNAELFELEDVVLGKRSVLKCAPAVVEAAVFTNGKRTVVIAVNTSKSPADAVVSGIPGKVLTEMFSSNAKLPVNGGSAGINIPAETSRIFAVTE